jgi:hypothetical protein
MSDALSGNWTTSAKVIVAKCLSHARRKFVEIEDSFPVECGYVLGVLGKDDSVEAETLWMSTQERLGHHQQMSSPLMKELKCWIEEKFKQKLVEPNSSLGKACQYMLNHWEGLTRFLHVEGCPIDNNLCERVLKRAVLNRKNSLFYKTQHGAAVSDILLSLIETCRLNKVSAFDYIVHLLENERELRQKAESWLPWNYNLKPSEFCLEMRVAA